MDFKQSLALAGPPVYFLLMFFLLALVLNSLKPKTLVNNNSSSMATVYLALAAISFLHTLYCILSLFQRSYYDYLEKLDYTIAGSQTDIFAHWLVNTSVFKEAWEYAFENIFTWWWIENLCIFTAGTWTLFLVTEGKRKEISYLWAYMVLAEFLAVSTASSLFYAALSYRAATPKPIPSKKNDDADDVNAVLPASEEDAEVSAQVIFPICLALFTISVTPPSSSPYFLLSIFITHILLFIPILPSPLQTRFPRFLNVPALTLYFGVAAIALALRVQSTLAVVGALDQVGIFEFASALFQALHFHPAVAAFGWDTIWASVAFIVWYIFGDGIAQPNVKSLLPIISSTAALGVSLSAPVVLGNVIDEIFAQPETKEDEKIKEVVAE